MTVTFWVPSAPRTRKLVPCDYGQGEVFACSAERRCGFCQDGVEEVWESPAPDLNVGNETAGVLIDILQLPGSVLYGIVSPDAIPLLRRRIIRALSSDLLEAKARPGGISGGPSTGQARFVDCGIPAERIRVQLTRLDAVFVYAQKNGKEVGWG